MHLLARVTWVLDVALIRARLQGASFTSRIREAPSLVRIIRGMQPSWASYVRPLWLSRLQDDVVCPRHLRTLHMTLYVHQEASMHETNSRIKRAISLRSDATCWRIRRHVERICIASMIYLLRVKNAAGLQ